jgi:HPt (histidine-containing phosphotransfer) domain-containing protein
MIDRQKFNDTFQYFDKDVLLKIIGIFEKELPERLETIRRNIREEDYKTLAFNAHSMKSAAGTFLASEPGVLASKIEQMAVRESGEQLPELFEQLKAAEEELLRELTEIRKEFLNGNQLG